MKSNKVLFILSLLLFTSFIGWAEPLKKYQDDETAIKDIMAKLKKYPQSAPLLFQMGWYMQKRNFNKLAQEYYTKCLNINPEYSPALINLGNLYASQKNMQEARQYFEKAIRFSPDSPEAFYGLGVFHLMNRDHEKAMHNFKKVVVLDPEYKEAYINLSAIHLHFYTEKKKEKQLEIAKNYLFKASKIFPKYAPAYFNLGKIFQLKAMYRIALEYFKKAEIYYPKGSYFHRKSIEIISQLKGK